MLTEPPDDVADVRSRLPELLFAAACIAAVPFYLWFGRNQWFYQDEFAVLVSPARNVGDLFRAHNEHMIVPARVFYAVWWEMFGLRAYVPYQLLPISAHVLLAVMMRAVLVRAGVSAWMASAGALVMLAFGRGHEDIVWGFQITFTGSVAAGYVHLVLADHDGPLGRRDLFGLVAGLVAVTSAGTGVVMVLAVGVATLLRRGVKVAAFHTIPVATVVGIWFLQRPEDREGSDPVDVLRFMAHGLDVMATRVTAFPAHLPLVAVCALVGVWWCLRSEGLSDLVRRSAVPLALAVAGILNWLLIGYSRADILGVEFAERSRYSHVSLAFVLPLVVVGLDGVVRRKQVLLVPIAALLLAGVPGNLRSVEIRANSKVPPELVLAVANSPILESSPPERIIFPGITGFGHITAGWLVDARRDGKVPDDDLPQWALADAASLLMVEEHPAPDARDKCVPAEGAQITLDAGDQVTLLGTWLVWIEVPGHETEVRPVSSRSPVAVVAFADDLELSIAPYEQGSGERCD